ncbi:MAG TPA: primosomal protein N' [Terriglobia bacterium]|nr:primosomal protein N' [Terriglobia bacterium]
MSRKNAKKPKLVKVAVMAALSDLLTYQAPDSMEVWPGQRILVPLGSRKATGIVIEPQPEATPGVKSREILKAIDAEPLLSPELLTLGLWVAEYYHAPPGETFRAMLPTGAETHRARVVELTERGKLRRDELRSSLLAEARQSEEARVLDYVAEHPGAAIETVRAKSASLLPHILKKGWIEVAEIERDRRKTFAVSLRENAVAGATDAAPQRRANRTAQRIIEALRGEGGAVDHRELLKSANATLATLRKMEQQGIIDLADSRMANRTSGHEWAAASISGSDLPVTLTPGQSSAYETLAAHIERDEFGVFLLHGVTGSGKTEVYLRLIARCLERGRSALLLVPEIALTPATQSLFAGRFGHRVALLHSGLSDRERQGAWWRIWRGEATAVLGTRSAVFAPLKNLGVVVVDEEHDGSYKQQETPRYSGRDVAIVRARLAGATAVLGSATPSLESYSNAQQGKYHLLTIAQRVQGRPLANVEIIDMRQEFRETHTQAPISRQLRQEIEAQLASGNQTMILLNRRGYSWFLLCRSCGEAVQCANCSISLTYHRREHRCVCHYCGYTTPVPDRCPACGSEHLQYIGEGTEKIEDKLAELFPQARVARLDRDVASRAGHYLRVLTDFRFGRIQILAGTQLIAKGHDFPGVTLVGVVSADMGLRLPDFRAAERTFQLLTQAAGRAGRGDSPGRVLVQTFYPNHYAIRFAADQHFAGFFSREMSFRRLMHYPPVTALANIIAQDKDLDEAAKVARLLSDTLNRVADPRHILIMGPNPAPLARIKGRYRIQILLKASSRAYLNQALRQMADECARRRVSPRSVIIDVDPASIM